MPRLASIVLAEIATLVDELKTATQAGCDCESLVTLIAAMQAVYAEKCGPIV